MDSLTIGGILSDTEILKEKEIGRITISPFKMGNLGNCSYDVSLGEWYAREHIIDTLCPSCPDIVKDYWSPMVIADILNLDKCKGCEYEDQEGQESIDFIKDRVLYHTCKLPKSLSGKRFIVLLPDQNILAHTEEFIGGRYNITTMLKAKSTIGRLNIDIRGSAGMGDVGYISRWSMRIKNEGHSPLLLIVGMKIGQIVFIRTGQPALSSYEEKGNYQVTGEISEIIEKWKPDDILPKVKLI